MDNYHEDQGFRPPVRRRRKRKPKWQRILHKYWPTIRFGLICLTFIGVVVWGIGAITSGISLGSTGDTTETTNETTTAPTVSQDNIEKLSAELIEEANFIAAGYDYDRAINLLKEFEYFDQVPALSEKIKDYEKSAELLVAYPDMDKITHIFFHSLIVDPLRAFDDDVDQDGYNLYMVTCDEFWNILEAMYAKGFVLVTPYQVASEHSNEYGSYFAYNEILLPEGKKPFIMSQDDLNYYSYMVGTGDGKNETPIFADKNGDGFAHKIVIGQDGYPTCEYMDENGNVTTGDYDLVPLLEKFIQLHPDFAYRGARAVLGMTGYEGVFGYRTKPSYESAMGSQAYAAEVQAAKEVAQNLKDHGWILASHSYGHPAYGNIGAERVAVDSDKWEATVQPIIGDADIILYPHGSDIAGAELYNFDNAKFAALYEDGYRYFFNVDSADYWCQLGENYYRGGRRNLDGYRMWYNRDMLDDLFDVDDIFDDARPTPVPTIN